MMKMKGLWAVALCLMLTSCYEEGYNVRNIDMTLHFGTDTLWTPYNCTGDIMLKGFVYQTQTVRHLTTEDGRGYFAVWVDDEQLTPQTGKYDVTLRAGTGVLDEAGVYPRQMTIGGMPDFLKEDDVVLDLSNPMVPVTAVNESPCTVTTHFTLRTYDAQGGLMKECVTDDVTLPPNSTTRLCLAESEPTKWLAELKGTRYIHTEGLSQIVRKIPHHVEMASGAIRGELEDEALAGGWYAVRFRFGIFVPFEFGPDFHLVAREGTDSLGFELADYADLQPGEIVVEARADNDIALDIDVTGHLLDQDGNDIKGLVIDKARVPAKEKDYPIFLRLKAEAPYKLNNFMDGSGGAKKLHHLKAEATLTTGEWPSELITTDSKLRLHHIRVGIVGGITINAN